MAENRRPSHVTADDRAFNTFPRYSNNIDDPPKRIDLAALARKSKSPMKARKSNIVPDDVDMPDARFETENHLMREKERQRKQHLGVSMDPARMQLISPPPEEMLMLRRISNSSLRDRDRESDGMGLAFASFSRSPTNSPSVGVDDDATSSRPVLTSTSLTTKRKRDRPSVQAAFDFGTSPPRSEQGRHPVEVTPNPKPRKQGRLGNTRTTHTDLGSPTRLSFTVDSTNSNDLHTTPTKPKKKVVIKSPHTRNPDADWIPPAVVTTTTEEDNNLLVPNPNLSAVARRALLKGGSRRSVTPIPPYEPPPDVFSPPREVFVSPPQSRSAPRKSGAYHSAKKSASKKVKALKVNTVPPPVQVKQELPEDVDLIMRAPMPPPSPSDDPLLLSGPPEVLSQVVHDDVDDGVARRERRLAKRREEERKRREEEVRMNTSNTVPEQVDVFSWPETPMDVRESTQASSHSQDEVLPPSSPEPPLATDDLEAVAAFDFQQGESQEFDQSTDSMQLDDPGDAEVEPVKLFDFGVEAADDDWSDSDEGGETQVNNAGSDEEGEGEYTGKWTSFRVKTKLDPPSSATKVRQDAWGHPVSPFPKIGNLDLAQVEEEQEDEEVLYDDEEEQEDIHSPEEFASVEEQHTDLETEEPLSEEEEVRRLSLEPDSDVGEEEEEEREVREMSMELEDEPEVEPLTLSSQPLAETRPIVSASQLLDDDVAMDDEEDSSDSETELGLVKITSADPMAAARAVAILKQHDYDCYTKLVKRRASHSAADDLSKESRRRSLASSGVVKNSHREKNRRRSTLGMGVIGDKVIMPGSPVMSLPELLEVAEKEVVREVESSSPRVWKSMDASIWSPRERNPFQTPVPNRQTQSSQPVSEVRHAGVREWTKDDWKLLDACFTDQRLAAGAGILASVDDVLLESVVSKFIDAIGGPALVHTFGEMWANDTLLERVKALQRKQRAGNVAPPTSPFVFASPSLGGVRRVPTMDVPEFTPLTRGRAPPPRRSSALSRPVLPSPIRDDAPFKDLEPELEKPLKKLPSTLLAPRYSHLLDDIGLGKGAEDSLLEESASEEATPAEPEDCSQSFSEGDSSMELSEISEHTANDSVADLTQADEEFSRNPQSSNIGSRVKGFFFSYLPTLSKAPATGIPKKSLRPSRPGLPLPPQSVLEKPRGPVVTPARPAIPRAPAPKELVQLNHAPLPRENGSNIPRRKVLPKRLVDLVHVEAPVKEVSIPTIPRPRSSSGSVKDMVKGFENMTKNAQTAGSGLGVRKAGSMNDLKRAWKASQPDTRPRWKP